jgi:hypothetical protein
MLEQQRQWNLPYPNSYNEVVIDAASYTAHLPSVVEAFFYTARANKEQRHRVRRARKDFVRIHGQSEEDVPLMRYDSAQSWSGEPFTAVRT